MTNLRKILEELVRNCEGICGEEYLEFRDSSAKAHQQILALIPKKKDDTCFCDSMKRCNCDIKERESFNQAIAEITHRLEGV